MAPAQLLLDAILVAALLLTAAASLLSRDLFRAVVMFIAFGLLMSLAWVRLHATDLAMAEAAIGAGLAGALLLDAVGHLGRSRNPHHRLLPMIEGLLCLALLALLAGVLVDRPAPSPALARSLTAAMESSGLSHEVTAVLLNFRGYDTFLEVSVLAVAAFASLALLPAQAPAPLHPLANRQLDALVVWLAPLMLLVTVYLFWAGSKEPGGAFQAGALLAASGVLLRLSGRPTPYLLDGIALRIGLLAGFSAFLFAGFSGPFLGLPLFTYSPDYAGTILVAVEAVLALSIGLTLLSLFCAVPSRSRRERSDAR